MAEETGRAKFGGGRSKQELAARCAQVMVVSSLGVYQVRGGESKQELRKLEQQLSWQAPETGFSFDLEYQFDGEVDDLDNLARHVVQGMFLADWMVFDDFRRKALGLQPAGMGDEDFWQAYRVQLVGLSQMAEEIAQRLDGVDGIKLREDPTYLAQVALVAVAGDCLSQVDRLSKGGLKVEMNRQTAGYKRLLPAMVRAETSKRSVGWQKSVMAYDYNRVLELVSDLVWVGGESRYERRRGKNIVQAGEYILGLDEINREDVDMAWRMLMAGESDLESGFRRSVITVGTVGRRDPVGAKEAMERVDQLVERINGLRGKKWQENEARREAAEIAAIFQDVHPMIGANGRLGHILTNKALKNMGQPGFTTPLGAYDRYVRAITKAIGGEYEDLEYLMKYYANRT